jgi:high-affinity iron transporter
MATNGYLWAANPESSRILVHTLNYIGHDYVHAVANGQVISEDEYHEMLEFSENAEKYFKEFSSEWSDADSAQVGALLSELITDIKEKAAPTVVAAKALEVKGRVIALTGLKTHPFSYPNLANGKKLYLGNCANCHGATGHGDGPDAKGMQPAARNFHDEERMSEIAPAHVFNTTRLGVQGTGMPPHPKLEDDEVWDVAFYLVSLRYEGQPKATGFPEISLEKISTESDHQLEEQFSLSKEQLAAIRLQQPVQGNDHFLKTAETYLDKVLSSYSGADNRQALKYASLAYLEGVEPVELHLKATDPELSEQLEKQFLHIRKMINEKRSESELSDSIAAARLTIQQAQLLLQSKEYSFWMALFMSLSILLREGLEAFLVIMVILSVLKATNAAHAARWVHAGWIAAILIGVILWFVSTELIAKSMASVELIEGIISFVAVAMLLYIGFWLHSKSEIGKWKEYVSNRINNVMNEGNLIGIAALSFFVVFREVFESVLFLSALNIESGGKQSSGILSGVLLSFTIVMVLAYFALRFSAKLPIPKLFKISSLVMGLLAVVLAGKGIHSFQEISTIPIHGIPLFRIELLGIYPTLETTLGQLLVAVILVLLNRKNKAA